MNECCECAKEKMCKSHTGNRKYCFIPKEQNTDRDRLIKIVKDSVVRYIDHIENLAENITDYLLANGVIVPPCKVGDEIWVIDREDGEAVDISCIQFLAKSKGCIIGTAWINDLDIDETIEYHIQETQENFDCELKVYPNEDCFSTKEQAEQALEECNNE